MLFPDNPKPTVPYEWHFDYATIISKNPESGRVQTRPGRTVALLYATLNYPLRPIADYSNLRTFCRAMYGMQTRFTFQDFNGTGSPPVAPWPVSADYGYAGGGAMLCTKPDGTAAVGDGSTRTFDLPFGLTTGATVYDNGNPAGSHSIGYATGADGRDRVTFTNAPLAGHTITAACTTGRLMIYARLATDSFTATTMVGGGGPIRPVLTIMQDVV
jgi:hypothetical protein